MLLGRGTVCARVCVCERDSTGNHVVPQDSPLPAPVLVLPLYGRCCVVRGRFATACLQHASVLLLALQPSLSLSPSLSLPPSLLMRPLPPSLLYYVLILSLLIKLQRK